MIINLSKLFSFISLSLFCFLGKLDNRIKVLINFLEFIRLLEMNNQLWLQDNFLSQELFFILLTLFAVHCSLECFSLYPCDHKIIIFD